MEHLSGLLVIAFLTLNLKLVSSLCNVYPKIFGEKTSNIGLYDMEIHEGTDQIVSCGRIVDNTIFHTTAYYPLIIVSSLTTTEVKWAVTDYSMANK